MKTKLIILVAAMLMLGAATPALAQKDEAKFCKTFADYKANRWTDVNTLIKEDGHVLELKFSDNEFKFRTREKDADKVLKKESLVISYAGHLYVNCRNLDCDDFSLDCANYAQAFVYSGDKLLFAAHKINDGALLATLALDVAGIATPGTAGKLLMASSSVVWYSTRELKGFRLYLLENSNDDGEAKVRGLNDAFMEKLLENDPALLKQYKVAQKKSDRLSASHILPILREKGLVKE